MTGCRPQPGSDGGGSREGAGARGAALGRRRRLGVRLRRDHVQQIREDHERQAWRVPQTLHRRVHEARVACERPTSHVTDAKDSELVEARTGSLARPERIIDMQNAECTTGVRAW